MAWSSKARAFWPLLATAFLADCATKQIAVEHLAPAYMPHEVFGEWIRFALAYNRNAAISIPLGSGARPLLAVLATVMIGVLGGWYRRTERRDWMTAAALGLIAGGALGNLLDRIRWGRGVVDFIDVGVGATRFPTFNVADAAITCGAVWLAWRFGRSRHSSEQAAA
jgi:signal peptidase II